MVDLPQQSHWSLKSAMVNLSSSSPRWATDRQTEDDLATETNSLRRRSGARVTKRHSSKLPNKIVPKLLKCPFSMRSISTNYLKTNSVNFSSSNRHSCSNSQLAPLPSLSLNALDLPKGLKLQVLVMYPHIPHNRDKAVLVKFTTKPLSILLLPQVRLSHVSVAALLTKRKRAKLPSAERVVNHLRLTLWCLTTSSLL